MARALERLHPVSVLSVLCAITVSLSACASMPEYNIDAVYDLDEVAWSKEKGSATVSGNAFLRQRNGGVVTCAGQAAGLTPVSQYSTSRMMVIYGNAMKGYRSADRPYKFLNTDEQYIKDVVQTPCNSRGDFVFKNVPAGSYYLTAAVFWEVYINPYVQRVQGGALMKKIEVQEGDNLEEVLTW